MFSTAAISAIAQQMKIVLDQREIPAYTATSEVGGRPWAFIAPDPVWPDYRDAKIAAGIRADGKTEELLVGMRWDKGLAPRARGYAPRRMLMDSAWAFNQLEWDALAQTLNTLSGPGPLLVEIAFDNGVRPGFQPFTTELRHRVLYRWTNGQLALERPGYDLGIPEALPAATSLADAMGILSGRSEWYWTWLTLTIGWTMAPPDRPSVGTRLGRDQLYGWLEPLIAGYFAPPAMGGEDRSGAS